MKKSSTLLIVAFLLSSTFNAQADVLNDLKQYGKDSWEIMSMLVKDPKHVAAFTASSPWLVREVVKKVSDSKKVAGRRILEIGFGPGTVTQGIINNLKPNDRLDAVEYLKSLYDFTSKKFPQTTYPNVHLHCSAFQNWNPTSSQLYDTIVCTVPFTKLGFGSVKDILDKSLKLLKPGGTFSYISLIGAQTIGHLKIDSKEREEYKNVLQTLKDWKYTHFTGKKESVFLNITPCWVYHLTKKQPAKKTVTAISKSAQASNPMDLFK